MQRCKCNSHSVLRSCASPNLIHNHKAPRCSVIQNSGSLQHLNHESRFIPEEIICRTHTTKHLIDYTYLGALENEGLVGSLARPIARLASIGIRLLPLFPAGLSASLPFPATRRPTPCPGARSRRHSGPRSMRTLTALPARTCSPRSTSAP